MGGKAIKKVQVSRFTLENLLKTKHDIINKFSEYLYIDFPIDLPGKDSFSDFDVLIKLIDPSINILELIIKIYSPEEIIVNGDIISFAYKLEDLYYQIDFIKCKNILMSKFYYSYGDLGAIIGRISKYYGLTFGSDGLWLSLYADTVNQFIESEIQEYNDLIINGPTDVTWNFGKIDLTNNPELICTYLDFDYKKWIEGFNSIEEIFDWVKNSSYFKVEIFESLNCVHKRRALLRPNYQQFIISLFGKIEFKNVATSEISKNIQLNALQYFNKKNELVTLLETHKKNKELKDKFNGNLLLESGFVVDPRQLGKFILGFKLFIKNQFKIEFEEWLDNNTKDNVLNEISKYSLL